MKEYSPFGGQIMKTYSVEADIAPMRDAPVIEAPKPGAVRRDAAGMARLQLPIEPDEIETLPVLPDQGALAGREIQQEHIVPARIAVVETYRDFVGPDVRPMRRHRTDVGEGREITQFASAGIDGK